MKLVISPVEKASVEIIWKNELRQIWKWLLIYIWISKEDCLLGKNDINEKIEKIVKKILNLKLIVDKNEKISLSVSDIKWDILLVSNFTLYGRNKKWNKIDFLESWDYEKSKIIYKDLVNKLVSKIKLKTWEFGAKMLVKSENLWPLNYVLEF